MTRNTDDPLAVLSMRWPHRPRVLASARQIAHFRTMVEREVAWACAARDHLVQLADDVAVPDALPAGPSPHFAQAASAAMRLAAAHHVTGESAYLERARQAMDRLAGRYPTLPLSPGGSRAAGMDHGLVLRLAQGVDLILAADAGDAERYEQLLRAGVEAIDNRGHRSCGNHNTHNIAARIAAASALADRQILRDALYGFESPAGLRYGLVHQLQHDILADGQHWERTIGYHFYTLMALTEIACMCDQVGLDLWHLRVDALTSPGPQDIHRDYGPPGTRGLKDAYDAPLYMAFTNGDHSLIHDSGIANRRGLAIWGTMYEHAVDAYRDPRHVWLLNEVYGGSGALPATIADDPAHHLRFLRLSRDDYTCGGRFSLATDARFGQIGRHEQGCTLLPATGMAVLRADASDPATPGAMLFWGPHSAGHQSPAALHVDIHAGGRRITDAPHSDGYGDSAHLTWCRSTIAHNTVTIDGTSMYPYDDDPESIWEADVYHGRDSDGELLTFEPSGPYRLVRAANTRVYPGVRLERTVIVARAFVLDIYRVTCERERMIDWAMHVAGEPACDERATPMRPADLGAARGYRHLEAVRQLVEPPADLRLSWDTAAAPTSARLILPIGATVYLAHDPPARIKHGPTGFDADETRRSSVIVRTSAATATFTSCWSVGGLDRLEACREEIDAVIAAHHSGHITGGCRCATR